MLINNNEKALTLVKSDAASMAAQNVHIAMNDTAQSVQLAAGGAGFNITSYQNDDYTGATATYTFD